MDNIEARRRKKKKGRSSQRRQGGLVPVVLRAALVAMAFALICLWSSTPSAMALTPNVEALLELRLAFNATVQRLTSWWPSDPNPCG